MKILRILCALVFASTLLGQETVRVDNSTKVLASPSAFWTANASAIASAISASYQPLDSDLTAIAALTTTSFGRGLLDDADASAARSTLGLVIGTNVQAYDATLSGLASTTFDTAGQVAYAMAADTFATITTTSFGRSLWDDVDAAAARTTLGLATISSTGSASDLSTGTVPVGRLPAATATTYGAVWSNTTTAADMPRIENRHALRDFAKAIYAYGAAPTTSRICIAYYGDSVASAVSEQFYNFLLNEAYPRCNLSYPEDANGALTYAVTGTALSYEGAARPVDQSIYDGSGGKADFTYLPSGRHNTLANGSILTFDANQSTGFSECRAYFASGPGMGSVFVELINRDTSAVVTSTTVSLSAGSLGVTKASFTGISTSVKYKIRLTATGTVVSLYTTLLKTNGIMCLNLAAGTTTLTQNNYANSTIFTGLCNDMGVSLIFCQAKEENTPASAAPTMTRLGLLTSTSKFVVGSLPDGGDLTTQLTTNALLRSNALSSGYAYFDGFAAIGSYAELVRLGWISDGVHALENGNRYVAGLIHGELAYMFWPGAVSRRSVDHKGSSSLYISTPSYRVPKSDNSETTVEFAVAAPATSQVQFKNVKRIYFDADGTTRAYLEELDSSGVQIKNSAGARGDLQVARIFGNSDWSTSGQIASTRSDAFSFSFSGGGSIAEQLRLTKATGTAPMQVTSTTRVANLNVATAGTADALTTARTINGTSFDGSSNITVTAAAGTLTGSTLASGVTASSITSTGTVTTGTWNSGVRLKGYTVATLPAGTQGDVAFVTDASAPSWNTTVSGGGSTVVRVFYNGSAWVAY